MVRRFRLVSAPNLCLVLTLAIAPVPVFADLLPIAWDGGASSDLWNAPLNWDLDVVPNNNPTDQFDVTLDAANVRLNQNATISGLTISPNASLSIDNHYYLRLTGGGTYINRNLISLNSTGTLTQILLSGGDVTLAGGGTIRLGDNIANVIRTLEPDVRLINEDNTIRGSGHIGEHMTAITNRGAMIAEGTPGLVIDPGVHGAINSGIFKAVAGATLEVGHGAFTNFEGDTKGRIIAEDAGTVLLDTCSITGGEIETQADGLMELTSAAIDADVINAGEMILRTSTSGASLKLAGDTLAITGGGSVTLDRGSIAATQSDSVFINEDNTIHGRGSIGGSGLAVINRGTINADASGQQVLLLQPRSIINSSVMKAEGSSTLELFQTTCTNFEDDTAGRFVAEDGALVSFDSSDVVGGQIDVRTDGIVYLQNADTSGTTTTVDETCEVWGFYDSTLDGAFTIHPGGSIIAIDGGNFTLTGNGPHVNDGLIGFGAYGRPTTLHFAGPADLEGSGTVTLKNNTTSVVFDADQSIFTNRGNTFDGAGVIDTSWRPFVNQGVIHANKSELLQINPPLQYGVFDNQGTISVTGSGGMTIYYGEFITSGQVFVAEGSSLSRNGDFVQTAGSTIINGELSASDGVFIAGMLGGSGTIDADVIHEGEGSIAPGVGVGMLTIDGNYEQSSTSILEIELGGTGQGESDLLAVGGNAMLNGVLGVSLVDGFYPEPGQTFEILTADSISGTFTSLLLVNIPSPLMAGVIYNANRVRLTFGAIPGLGACCHEDGSCEVIDEASCDLPGDLFSLGEPCSPLTCPELVECCTGDVNGDQFINGLDVDAFVKGLLNPPTPGTLAFCRLDANQDRLDVDIDDVAPFVALLLEGAACEITCCPGDLNGDNLLNGSDIAPLQQAIDNPPPRGTIEFCRADVNEDGYVNNADATALLFKLLAGETCPGSALSLRQVIEEAKLRAAEPASVRPAGE